MIGQVSCYWLVLFFPVSAVPRGVWLENNCTNAEQEVWPQPPYQEKACWWPISGIPTHSEAKPCACADKTDEVLWGETFYHSGSAPAQEVPPPVFLSTWSDICCISSTSLLHWRDLKGFEQLVSALQWNKRGTHNRTEEPSNAIQTQRYTNTIDGSEANLWFWVSGDDPKNEIVLFLRLPPSSLLYQ